jgi:glycosyltransferase involved in cell wall biosynthesis
VRIALVTSLQRGGPLEQALALARCLVVSGDAVQAVCTGAQVAERFTQVGARSAEIPLRHPLDLPAARRVWAAVEGADVVHAHDRRSGLWVRLGPRPRRDGVRIYTVHGLPEPYLPPPVGPSRPGLRAKVAYGGLDRALAHRADAVVVPSQAVADILVRRLGFPSERLRVVPNGVEPFTIEPGPVECVGTVSVLEPVKGLDLFLRAAALVAARRPAVHFAIFGEGSQRGALEALAGELGLDDRVIFHGHVAQARSFAELGVFVLSSHMENSPMALLEALAAGVPAVVTRVGGVPEITGEDAATLVPAGDHTALAHGIEQLLDDPARRADQAAAGRRRVAERHTARRNAQAMRDVYERAQHERRARA